MRTCLLALIATVLVSWSAKASAHFPFLHAKEEGGAPALHVYFAESAEPDNPALLDRLAGADVWRVGVDGTSEPLSVAKGANSLTAALPDAGPAAFGFLKDYGVLERNGETFGLVYYAKTFTGPDAWSTRPGERSQLDLVPEREGERLTLTAYWDGKPLAGAEVVVQGGADFHEGKTGEDGRFACEVTSKELYSIRVKHVEDAAGEKGGKKFDAVRHYATLTLDLE